MVTINPLRSGVGGLLPPVERITPTETGLARTVVLDPKQDRQRREGRKDSQARPNDRNGEDQGDLKELPHSVYNPHAGLVGESVDKSPLDVVA
jgi:hypothetical protein